MVLSMRSLLVASDHRRKYGNAWRTVSTTFGKLLMSQSPNDSRQAERLTELLDRLADVELSLSEAEGRGADDFRDIIERYDVLFRVNESYLQAKSNYQLACQELEAAIQADQAEQQKASYQKNKFLLQAKVIHMKDGKRKAIKAFRAATLTLIDCRTKYTTFKVRRLTHGWSVYGTTLLKTVQAETAIFTEIKEILIGFKKSGAVPAQHVAAIEKQIISSPTIDAEPFLAFPMVVEVSGAPAAEEARVVEADQPVDE
jgi:hypothetical protein